MTGGAPHEHSAREHPDAEEESEGAPVRNTQCVKLEWNREEEEGGGAPRMNV